MMNFSAETNNILNVDVLENKHMSIISALSVAGASIASAVLPMLGMKPGLARRRNSTRCISVVYILLCGCLIGGSFLLMGDSPDNFVLVFGFAALLNTVSDTFTTARLAEIKEQKIRGLMLTTQQLIKMVVVYLLDNMARIEDSAYLDQ